MADKVEIEEMILNMVTKKIRDEFDKTEIKAIYKDQTPQNFTKPCIVVLLYDSQEEHLLNHTARYYVYFDILLHIEFDSNNLTGIYTAMRKFSQRLARVLDYITLDKEITKNRTISLKKHNWNAFVEDGVGHCMVNYDYIASLQDGKEITPITSVVGDNYIKQ